MNQERLIIQERNSKLAEESSLVISAIETYGDHAKIVIGRPGLPNVECDLRAGGAVLFETPEGLFEVRVLSTTGTAVEVLLTRITPTPGITAGFVDQDQSNTPFSLEERHRIAASIDSIRTEIGRRTDISPQQLEFVSKKLDEMREASERLGRKDWMNLALGTLTSVVVTAALASPAAKAIFAAAGTALSWLFGTGLKLLP
jgi:hypothetical protein